MYPALTALRALTQKFRSASHELSVLWVGGVGGMEEDLVNRAGVAFKSIPAAGVHGVGWKALPGNLLRLARGFWASHRILREFQPDVLLFTGGYLAVPMALAAQRLFGRRTPALLLTPDIEPGLALQTLARFAQVIAAPAEDSKRYFKRPERIVVTGYPVRPELLAPERSQAFDLFKLEAGVPVLLVLGGSSGAQSINRALVSHLDNLLPRLQIIHLTGQRNWEDVQKSVRDLPADIADRYHPFPYLHEEMGAALRVADLVVSRAGASSLGEYPAFGLPAILVPYPHAWRYQQVNAEYLARQGAARILADADLDQQLGQVVTDLLNHPEQVASMRQAMLSLACPGAAQQIAELITNLGLNPNLPLEIRSLS
ncbi:MAG: UDP-N-acetylglucosamine--N-acetylmuramyl-(pentapeptide) pyrophosphoryl-undecaprenol N-acetylglucosamine transferase [Anaerolineales bacterium]|nr:UDP-N-acetylglucosamine--N-acetylmuramyl-(pentapeptide) pyrophosphoryl-undecaprenol N-acetylglucosamine transferase [Anaerolineales bacterium]